MNRNLIITIIGCLIIGFVGGALTSRHLTKKRIHRMMDTHRPPPFFEKMKTALDLNSAQEKQLEEIFEQHMKSVQEVRHEERKRMKGQMDSLFTAIRPILQPDQQTKLDAFEQHLRKRHQKHKKHGRKQHQATH